MTIGNNHIGDAGPDGVIETIHHLEKLGIAHVGAGRDGATARTPAWFDIAGQRVALFGYDAVRSDYNATEKRSGSAGLVSADYRADIAAARGAGANVVVVLPHWGAEYSAAPTSRQRAHARALAAAGTTLILGSHSHWAGAMELIDGRPVLSSLGDSVLRPHAFRGDGRGTHRGDHFRRCKSDQIRLHPTVMVDLVQPNLLDAAGDGEAVIERMRMASDALPGR